MSTQARGEVVTGDRRLTRDEITNGWLFNRHSAEAFFGLFLLILGLAVSNNICLVSGAWVTFCAGIAQICRTIKNFDHQTPPLRMTGDSGS